MSFFFVQATNVTITFIGACMPMCVLEGQDESEKVRK